MATKIQFRQGNSAQTPSLDIGEPGWDVDTKVMNVGDGSSTPPQLMTTKSSGEFAFLNIASVSFPRVLAGQGTNAAPSIFFNSTDAGTGIYSPGTGEVSIASGGTDTMIVSPTGVAITGDVTVEAGNTFDGIDLSALNPSSTTGIMVLTGNSAYAFRTLQPGPGIAPITDGNNNANADGTAGNLTIGLAPNPTIPGNAAMLVPFGTDGNRTGVTLNNGLFRYNTTGNYFEGCIDGEWRPFVDYVSGHTAVVPDDFPDIQSAINYYASRSTAGNVTVQLGTGTYTINSALNAASTTNSVIIQGATPIPVAMNATTPVVSVTGSPGSYQVKYNLQGAVPTGITTDHSIVIDSIYGTGDAAINVSFNFAKHGAVVTANALTTVNAYNSNYNFNHWYNVGDYIMLTPQGQMPQVRQIQAIPNNQTLTLATALGGATGTNYFHRRVVPLTGTLAATNSATIAGTGTNFTRQLNPGDMVRSISSNQWIQVQSITNDTTFVATAPVTLAGEICVSVTSAYMHLGCWKITAIDTINNTVTVLNTSQYLAPPVFGISAGVVNFLPSAILFTNAQAAQITAGQSLGFNNVTIRYVGSQPNTNIYGLYNAGGAVLISGYVGLNGCAVYLFNGGTMDAFGASSSLSVCGISGVSFAVGLISNSSLQVNRLTVNGNNGYGLNVNNSTVNVTGFSSVCGNGLNGVYNILDGSVSLGVMGSVSYNGNDGVYLSGSSKLGATAFAFNSNGGNGFNLSKAAQCHVPNQTLVLGNGQSGVYARAGSVFTAGGIAISGNSSHGMVMYTSTADIAGVSILNNPQSGITLRSGSKCNLDGAPTTGATASAIDYCGFAPIGLLSFAVGCAEQSTFTAQSLKITKRTAMFDIHASYGSQAIVNASLGSGTSGAFLASPLPNTYSLANNGSGVFVNGILALPGGDANSGNGNGNAIVVQQNNGNSTPISVQANH